MNKEHWACISRVYIGQQHYRKMSEANDHISDNDMVIHSAWDKAVVNHFSIFIKKADVQKIQNDIVPNNASLTQYFI